MSDRVRLRHLEALRSRMSHAPWREDIDDEMNYCGVTAANTIAVGSEMSDVDAKGIAATHNAADVLIEIASAALALQGYYGNARHPENLHAERVARLQRALEKVEP